jgi:ABC-type methionine transport system permease subunit
VKSKTLLQKILYVIFLLFLLYLIIELTRKILGGSLGFEELVIGLLIANLGFSFYLREGISALESKVAGHTGWHQG